MKIRFDITPQPKQSAFFWKSKSGKMVSFQPQKQRGFYNDIRYQAMSFNADENFYTENPIIIKNLVFAFPWLSTARKKDKAKGWIPKATKPDIDNLLKAFFDAIQGVFFKDDMQIYKIENLQKIYSEKGYIELEMLTEEEYNKRNEEVLGVMARGMTNI